MEPEKAPVEMELEGLVSPAIEHGRQGEKNTTAWRNQSIDFKTHDSKCISEQIKTLRKSLRDWKGNDSFNLKSTQAMIGHHKFNKQQPNGFL